jgi:hypothetical protein
MPEPNCKLTLAGISIDDTLTQVTSLYPGIKEGQQLDKDRKIYSYDGLSIIRVAPPDKEWVAEVKTASSDFVTERGIRVGDDFSKVASMYGDETHKVRGISVKKVQDGDFTHWIYLSDKDPSELIFVVNNQNKVIEIRLACSA